MDRRQARLSSLVITPAEVGRAAVHGGFVVVFLVFRRRLEDVTMMPTAAPAGEETLSTGQAARLLGCSRQHVVDLCNEGLLPYTSVGTHRRVQRRDIQAIRAGTDQLQRSERRSLWLAYAVAGAFAADPEKAINGARRELARMRPHVRGRANQWLDEWGRLLDGPPERLLAAMTDPSERGRELRQNSPFAGLLTEAQRGKVLDAWQRSERAHTT